MESLVKSEDRRRKTDDGQQNAENRYQWRKQDKTQKGTRMSERIESYRDLNVYKLAFELQQEIFEMSKEFPSEERFSLTDQIRRSSRSIGANITEAWQKRRYIAQFVSKLTDADGENSETQHWLETASASQYIVELDRSKLIAKSIEIGKMLGSMLSLPEKFCRKTN